MYSIEEKICNRWKNIKNEMVMRIEKNNDIYNCIWMTKDNIIALKGIGIVIKDKLLVSRFSTEKRSLSNGGIGIYIPTDNNTTLCAVWASFNSSCIGSGSVIKLSLEDSYDGKYKVRYTMMGHNSPFFNVSLLHNEVHKNKYYGTWFLEDKKQLHAVGYEIEEGLALAWGELNINWELMIFTMQSNDMIKCFNTYINDTDYNNHTTSIYEKFK